MVNYGHVVRAREIRPLLMWLVALAGIGVSAGLSRAGTVVIGDESRGVVFRFPDRWVSALASAQPGLPFSADVDETDDGSGGSARVRATYESVLGAELSRASGTLDIERNGRPAAGNAGFLFQFLVLDSPTTLTMAFDAEYERFAGDADPAAATGLVRLRHSFQTPTPRVEEVVFHSFALGADGDDGETFNQVLELEPGTYTFQFDVGLPQGPPDFNNWTVEGTSVDRSDRVSFTGEARFASAGPPVIPPPPTPGPSVIPLPPAALSGGGMLAAFATLGWLRNVVRRRSTL